MDGDPCPTPAGPPELRAVLTAQEIRRLTVFKWRMALEDQGFTQKEVDRLLFIRWYFVRQGTTLEAYFPTHLDQD